MLSEFTEIKRLHVMLNEVDIPHEFKEWKHDSNDGYQLCYPFSGEGRVCNVVQTNNSYGGEDNRLEIMGLLTDEEREEDDVAGWLTAEEVFARIAFHWKMHQKRGE